jgi:hypothetical protein
VDEYDGRQFVGIDLHRGRSVIVPMTPEGERPGSTVRVDNDPFELAELVASWGESPEVVLEANTAGTGLRTCWPTPARPCTWRIPWGLRVSRTGG